MSERALASREESFQVRALGWVASGFIRLLRSTLLLRFHGQEEIRRFERENRRFLLAFWHRHLLLMVYGYRGPGITILISQHRDGALIAETVRHFGVHSSRGSSTRGAVAGVRDMLRLARSGMDLALTPDGPKGPARVAKIGAVQLAALAGMPIIPVALAAGRAKLLRSWDRFVVPKPFSKVHFVYGEPFWVEREADLEAASQELTERLNALEARAEELAGGAKP